MISSRPFDLLWYVIIPFFIFPNFLSYSFEKVIVLLGGMVMHCPKMSGKHTVLSTRAISLSAVHADVVKFAIRFNTYEQ